MNDEISSLGITVATDEKFPSGIGYIAIPSDIDRKTYILDCYQNFRVSIQTAHDGFMNRVMISEEDLNWITFPDDYTKLGSPVLYITDPINNMPFVAKRYNTTAKLGAGGENTFSLNRVFKQSLVEITGNPEKGYLNVSVSNDSRSELNINVLNKNNVGALNLTVKGSMNVATSQDINFIANGVVYSKVFDPEKPENVTESIQTNNAQKFNAPTFEVNGSVLRFILDKMQEFTTPEVLFTVEDKVSFITKLFAAKATDGTTLETPSFKINDGKENFVLGQKLKKFKEDFIKELAGSTVNTMLGTMPLINAAQITAFTNRIDEFLSSIGYIDK